MFARSGEITPPWGVPCGLRLPRPLAFFAFFDRRLEPLLDQTQHASVHHAHPQTSHQLVVRDAVEVAFQVCVIDRTAARPQLLPDGSPTRHAHCVPDGTHASSPRSPPQRSARGSTAPPLAPLGLLPWECPAVSSSHWPSGYTPVAPLAAIGLLSKFLRDLFKKSGFTFPLDLSIRYPIHSGRSAVGSDLIPGRLQRRRVAHQSIQTVEAITLLLFGFHAQLLSPVTEFRRQGRFPNGQLPCRCSVVGWFSHPNQLRFFLSPLRSCQGPLAPRALPRFLATMGLSDSPTANARLMSSTRASSRSSRSQRPGSPSLPNPTFPARCPLSPRRTPTLLVNVSSRRMSGFGLSGRLAVLTLCNEADIGFACATARRFAPRSFDAAIAPGAVRFSTCWTFSWHDEHLSVHWFGWRCWRTGLHGLTRITMLLLISVSNPHAVSRARSKVVANHQFVLIREIRGHPTPVSDQRTRQLFSAPRVHSTP